VITQFSNSLAKKLSKHEQSKINKEIEQLLIAQKELLKDLSEIYFKALRVFGDYDFLRKQVLIDITDFETYLDERLFWVPSLLAINLEYPGRLYNSLQWFLSPRKWLQTMQSLLVEVRKNQLKCAVFTMFLILIFYINIQLKSHLNNIRKKVEKVYTDKLHYTFQVFLANIISAAMIPLCLAFIAYLLSSLDIQENFTRAVGAGLQQLAISFFILRFFLKMLEDNGIAQLHFSWSIASTQYISKQIVWLQFIVFPSFFVIYLTANVNNTIHSDSLGRLSLIIFMLALSYCFIKAFNNHNSGLQGYIKQNKNYWWVKIRYLWVAAIITIPFVIIGFALAGYYLSALELQQKVIITLRLIFIAVIVHSLIIRWLSLLNRKMALNNARKKTAAHDLPPQDTIILEEEILDISTIN
jgi:potassium efflux system protein